MRPGQWSPGPVATTPRERVVRSQPVAETVTPRERGVRQHVTETVTPVESGATWWSHVSLLLFEWTVAAAEAECGVIPCP